MAASALLAGALIASHVAVLTLFLNPDASLARDGAALLAALFLPYLVAGAILSWVVAVVGGAVARGWPRRRPALDALPWFASLAFLVTCAGAALYATNLFSYRHSIPAESVRGLAGAALALAGCALVLVAIGVDVLLFPLRGRGLTGALAILAAAASVVVPLALRPPPPPRVEQAVMHADRIIPARRVILVGVDGIGPDLVRQGLDRGTLPSFEYLLRRGAHGPLGTLRPTEGPPVWTSIVTGALPRAHGVKSFITYRLAGSSAVFELLPKGLLVSALEKLGLVATAPVTSAARRRPALWNALNAFAVDAGVVRLWGTHPVERIHGFMLSPRLSRGRSTRPAELLHPLDLMEEVQAQVVSGDDVDRALVSEFVDRSVPPGPDDERLRRLLVDEALAPDFTYQRAGNVLRTAYDPPFFATYFYGLDVVGHAFLRFAEPGLFGNVGADSARRYGRVVERYATLVGERVVALVEARRPDDIVILVSGYGMEPATLSDRLLALLGGRGAIGGTHERAPDGYFLAIGPGIRPGAMLQAASVVDVAPTILYLMGLPVARDMDGRVLTEILDESFARTNPLTFIPSYGRVETSTMVPAPAERSDEPHEGLH
jgi:predicted AlkP superfamily phosphohydrolase/phosphomutase